MHMVTFVVTLVAFRGYLIHRTAASVGTLHRNADNAVICSLERLRVVAPRVCQSSLATELTLCDTDGSRDIRVD